MKRVALFLLFATPLLSFAATKTIMDFAKQVTTIINMAIAVLITAAIAIFFGAIVRNFSSVSEDKAEMKRMIAWGVLAIFCMVSVWGLVALIQNSILL